MRRFAFGCFTGVVLACMPALLQAEGPAFDCARAEGAVEELICQDAELALRDRRLNEVFEAVTATLDEQALKLLRAEQRGWIKGRNDCWKAQGEDSPYFLTESWKTESVRDCVQASYQQRTSELRAVYGLATTAGPFHYDCEDGSAGVLEATFFRTDPPTVRLERGGREVIAWQVVTGSGARYEGQNVTFWAKRDEATVTWLDEKSRCSVRHE